MARVERAIGRQYAGRMPSGVYNTGKGRITSALLSSGNVFFLTIRDNYTFDPDHATVTAVLAAGTEATGTSRAAVPGAAGTINNTDNRFEVDRTAITLTAVPATQNIRGIVWFDATVNTNDGTRIPLLFEQLPSDVAASGVDIVINPAANVARLT